MEPSGRNGGLSERRASLSQQPARKGEELSPTAQAWILLTADE